MQQREDTLIAAQAKSLRVDHVVICSDPVLELLHDTVVNTISFYADSGDIVSAAYMALVFYVTLTGDTSKNGINQPPVTYQKEVKSKPYLQRVLCSYLETLQHYQLHEKATELIKYGPKLCTLDLEEKSPFVFLLCPYCMSKEAKCVASFCTNCKRHQARCAICQLPVTGMYIWC